MATSYLLQEDGTSKFTLEDGSGFIILESGVVPTTGASSIVIPGIAGIYTSLQGLSFSPGGSGTIPPVTSSYLLQEGGGKFLLEDGSGFLTLES